MEQKKMTKNNFKRMFETCKEDMRKSLKEMEEKTNKKLEDITKSLKENQEKATYANIWKNLFKTWKLK